MCDDVIWEPISAVLQCPGSCGVREFSFPWWVVVASVCQRTDGKLPYEAISLTVLYLPCLKKFYWDNL